jgi:hypothetical protein
MIVLYGGIIFTESLWSRCVAKTDRIHLQLHRLMGGLYEKTIEGGAGVMIYIYIYIYEIS